MNTVNTSNLARSVPGHTSPAPRRGADQRRNQEMSRDHAVHEPNAILDWRSSSRRAALVAGLLFIVADVAGFAGDALLRSSSGPDDLPQLYTHGGLVAA